MQKLSKMCFDVILNLKYVLLVMSWHCTVLHSRLLENVFCTHCHSNHGTSHAHRMVSEHVRAFLIFSAECHLKPLSLWMIFSLAPFRCVDRWIFLILDDPEHFIIGKVAWNPGGKTCCQGMSGQEMEGCQTTIDRCREQGVQSLEQSFNMHLEMEVYFQAFDRVEDVGKYC